MRRPSRFTKGVFHCQCCERMTRGDDDSAMVDMCSDCYELAGYDNMHNDNGTKPTAEELEVYEGHLTTIRQRGGNHEQVRAMNVYLFGSE